MAKNQNKTVATKGDVPAFLDNLPDARRAEETRAVVAMMQEVTGEQPVLWGSIVGFGSYHYKYDSGREGDFFMTGVAPRKTALTVYVMPGFSDYDALLEKLGPHSTGKSCLYIKRLEKVDMAVLREIVTRGYDWMRTKYHG